MVKVEIQSVGYKREFELEILPRIGEKIHISKVKMEVLDIIHKPEKKKIIVQLISIRN